MIGKKTKLTLQRASTVADTMSAGEDIYWYNVGDIEGVLTNKQMFEASVTGRPVLFSTDMFWCDYPKHITITAVDRFVLDTRVFNIVALRDPAERHLILGITLKEAV